MEQVTRLWPESRPRVRTAKQTLTTSLASPDHATEPCEHEPIEVPEVIWLTWCHEYVCFWCSAIFSILLVLRVVNKVAGWKLDCKGAESERLRLVHALHRN